MTECFPGSFDNDLHVSVQVIRHCQIPSQGKKGVGFTLFYLSLGLTLAGVISIVGFVLRVAIHRDEMLSRLVGLSFRQAVLLSALAVIALILRSRDLLSWWNSILLIVSATIVEFIFISLGRKPTAVPPQT